MSDALIFIVDDDPSASKGVARLLASASYRTETFSSAAEFLARPPYDGPSCLVLDLSMPGMTGLELQKQLADSLKLLPIVFMTGRGDIPSSVRAMKHGAVDFLLKPFTAEELLRAVETGIERQRGLMEEAAQRAVLERRWQTLTPREREVFVRIVAGTLNKQVAFEFGISEKTIKIHRAHVMEKMEASSFAELVRMGETLRPVIMAEVESGTLPPELALDADSFRPASPTRRRA
jgi:FixJ family two-component response regulator